MVEILTYNEFLNEGLFKEKVHNWKDLYILDDPKYTDNPFVTTIKQFQKYCERHRLPCEPDVLQPVDPSDDSWMKMRVDPNVIILH